MVTLVHITPEKYEARIRRRGLKASSIGKLQTRAHTSFNNAGAEAHSGLGVYCFPRLDSFTLTHQWVREVARFHVRQPLVAVTVRIADNELVEVGHYSKGHSESTAAQAVAHLRALNDPRGWEVFVPRHIEPSEVHSIRPAPRVTGWRYFPDSHEHVPCTCRGCLSRGEYGQAQLRRARTYGFDEPLPSRKELLTRLAQATEAADHGAIAELIQHIGSAPGRQRWRGPVRELASYVNHPNSEVRRQLADAIFQWRTPGVDDLLSQLVTDDDPEVRETAQWALTDRQWIYGEP